ncbi:MAG: hypothetical protein RL672_282 [Actinomycetota bacterium]
MLIELTLIGKPGCHLCEDAEAVVAGVVEEFKSAYATVAPTLRVELAHKNILEDEALALRHSEEIPVLQINGKTHGYWRIDAGRLRAALEAQLTQPQIQRNERCV